MKFILLTIISFFAAFELLAQNTLQIHKTDGSVLEIPLSGIDSITYSDAPVTQAYHNVVLDWNNIALNLTHNSAAGTNIATRIMAINSIAVYDAINSIKKFGTAFHYSETVTGVASIRAAAAQASHDVLVNFYPQQKNYLDSILDQHLNSISEPGVISGKDIGARAAKDILILRSGDGASPNLNYNGIINPGPGVWRPTPSDFLPAANLQWATLKPFVLSSSGQFRPQGPPHIDSSDYIRALNEVKDMGAKNSTLRTTEQKQIAYFFMGNPENVVCEVADFLIRNSNKTIEESSYILLLINITHADARIAVWDAKYTFKFWRPVTALNADSTGSVTNNYEKWTPLLGTPAHPSYLSGHSCSISSSMEILRHFFGENHDLTIKPTVTGYPSRFYKSLSQIEAENGLSRIYGGIHFSFDNTDAQVLGKKVAQYVLQNGPEIIEE
jgi:hypothetical protein